jgi:glycerophosphoryl diester phosphodiesterase
MTTGSSRVQRNAFQCVRANPRLLICAVADGQLASWTWAKANSKGRILPQTIAHRGYKAEHPENTLKAFEGAVEVGTHAIETDIHLSKDDVVVLSHVSLEILGLSRPP